MKASLLFRHKGNKNWYDVDLDELDSDSTFCQALERESNQLVNVRKADLVDPLDYTANRLNTVQQDLANQNFYLFRK